MSLAPGKQFGHYEILALIGRGGMGEVYRASDLKLNQPVARKFLPPAASEPSRPPTARPYPA